MQEKDAKHFPLGIHPLGFSKIFSEDLLPQLYLLQYPKRRIVYGSFGYYQTTY